MILTKLALPSSGLFVLSMVAACGGAIERDVVADASADAQGNADTSAPPPSATSGGGAQRAARPSTARRHLRPSIRKRPS